MAESFRIVWAPAAIRDLDEIIEYIAAHDSPESAIRIYDRIADQIHFLSSCPTRCRVVLELKSVGVHAFRELVVFPYRIFYRVMGRVVGIVGVLDGRRDLQEILFARALEYIP